MAIEETQSLLHWNYFLALESDVERLARFLEFTSKNFDAYSIEMAHLFLAAASEVDVVAKQLCSELNGNANAKNMDKYRELLRRCYPEMETSSVTIPRYGLALQPWINWRDGKNPDWWQDHNKVKHERGEYFSRASLKNVLNAMGGLFLAILYYYRDAKDAQRIVPPPSLFTPPTDLARITPTYGGPMALSFETEARNR